MMALWGNLHGGFIIGIATLAAYACVAGLQDLIAGRGLARAFRLSLITIAGTLATLVSPYGIDAWRVVLNALKDYAAQPIIADWQPLLSAIARGWHTNPADTVFFLCGVLMMLAFVVAFVREPHGERPPARRDRHDDDGGRIHGAAELAARDDRMRRAARASYRIDLRTAATRSVAIH